MIESPHNFKEGEFKQVESLLKHIKSGNLREFVQESEKVIAQKIDINIQLAGGWTCLHYAAYAGRSNIISILIEQLYLYISSLNIVRQMLMKLPLIIGHLCI